MTKLLDTMSNQKIVIGCAPEYLLGHDRIFMRKDI